MRRCAAGFGSCLLLAACLSARPAGAQPRRAPTAEVSGGWAGFVDDATINNGTVGGAAVWEVSPRVRIGPELIYMMGPDRDRRLFATGKLLVDLIRPRTGRSRVTPYVVADGGFSRYTDRIGTGTFTSYEGAVSGGGGVRLWVSDRVYLAPEIRLGWELHTRATLTVGFAPAR